MTQEPIELKQLELLRTAQKQQDHSLQQIPASQARETEHRKEFLLVFS